MKTAIKEVLSNGYVLGKIRIFSDKEVYKKESAQIEWERFVKAKQDAIHQIEQLKQNNAELSQYLTAQELMVDDPGLNKGVKKAIEEGKSVADAILCAMETYIDGLKNSSSTYLQERVADLEDVEQRLIFSLMNDEKNQENEPYILVIDTLYPSYLISHRENILGVIIRQGGYTSHSAILCRMWDIPLVISEEEFVEGQTIIIDTRKNLINHCPTEQDQKEFQEIKEEKSHYEKKAIDHGDFLFLANVSSNTDLKKVIQYGFDGIGLYRTEFIFMNQKEAYTFQQQYEIYRQAVEMMKGKWICFRTFDIGDDKQIPYMVSFKKGIENYKNNPIVFINQVKALLKANVYGTMKIMFPMIASREEFLYLKRWVLKIREENHYNMVRLGMMLETKEALEHIQDFDCVDFISIGTNDLTAEIYKINREMALNSFEEYMKDLIQRLKPVVEFCEKNHIELSICGELASVRKAAIEFYKLGIKNLSVAPSAIQMLNLTYTDFISK